MYRRKSFRKKNSSLASDKPRGSAVGGTTNDSIASARDRPFAVYNAYGTEAVSCLPHIDSRLGASGGSCSTDREKGRGDPISGAVVSTAKETHFLLRMN